MKIIWNSTGDFLNLDVINQELAEYWVNALSQEKQNNFQLINTQFDNTWLVDLQQHIEIIHFHLSSKLKINSFECFVNANLLDQDVLNRLHRTWIGTLEAHPSIPTFLRKVNSENKTHWDQINKKLHFIELYVNGTYHPITPYWEVNNPFGDKILNFNKSQISISFSQKGRSTFNKWMNQDYNINDTDTNNFAQIGAEINIHLARELIQDPPRNYLAFCQDKNMPVVGDTLNLANFANYDSYLTKIRQTFIRNLTHENNTASFEF